MNEVLTCKSSYTSKPIPMIPIASNRRDCTLELNKMKEDVITLKAQVEELKALTFKISQANSTSKFCSK